ncbi:MAG: CRISPR-associated endonuclease Cas1 [Desulfohalobiaceae bacterium]|nr:CRISPR-associated endonuclease Cas1 [Desulfohalobiaceae bacterium]
MIVYVQTQGSRIVKEGRHLLVKKEGDTYNTLFVYKLEQLVLFGNVQLTPPALSMLFSENVDTVFLRKDGRYLGRLGLPEPKNIFLRLRQYERARDDEFRLRVARNIVSGKLANMATLLARLGRRKQGKETKKAGRDVRNLGLKAGEADSLDQLMGYEGAASGTYYHHLGMGLQSDWGFTKRVRRPPTDPVNSVLSLLYTFLTNRTYAAVRQAGLDPYPGALHSLDYGRHSLPLDLVEEFRTPVADALMLSLFNQGVIKEEDFRYHKPEVEEDKTEGNPEEAIERACNDPIGQVSMPEETEFFDLPEQKKAEAEERSCDGKMPVRLTPEALRRVVQAFEKKMASEFHHPVAERRLTYSETLVYQAGLYRRVVEGDAATYPPFVLK